MDLCSGEQTAGSRHLRCSLVSKAGLLCEQEKFFSLNLTVCIEHLNNAMAILEKVKNLNSPRENINDTCCALLKLNHH